MAFFAFNVAAPVEDTVAFILFPAMLVSITAIATDIVLLWLLTVFDWIRSATLSQTIQLLLFTKAQNLPLAALPLSVASSHVYYAPYLVACRVPCSVFDCDFYDVSLTFCSAVSAPDPAVSYSIDTFDWPCHRTQYHDCNLHRNSPDPKAVC